MDLAQLRGKVAHLAVEFDGETLHVEYKPHLFGRGDQRAISAANRTINRAARNPDDEALADLAEEAADALVPILKRLMTAWDLKDGDQTLPINDEVLREVVPPLLRGRISDEMFRDMGKRGTRPDSDSGSAPQAALAIVRNGTAS